MRVVTAAPFVPVCEISRLQLIDWIVSEIAWSRHLGWRMSSCRDSMVSKPIILGILVGTLFAAIPIHATNKTYETGKLNEVEIKDMHFPSCGDQLSIRDSGRRYSLCR